MSGAVEHSEMVERIESFEIFPDGVTLHNQADGSISRANNQFLKPDPQDGMASNNTSSEASKI